MISRLAEIAISQVGVREVGGNNCGPKIREYQAATDLAPAAWPWCAAFVDWCIKEWLIEASVRDWLGLKTMTPEAWRPKTAAAFGLNHWAKGKPNTTKVYGEKFMPYPGDIIIFDFSHCGIVIERTKDKVVTVEGNTNGKGERDSTSGDGVWRKIRTPSLAHSYIRINRSLLAEPLKTKS
jgi:hypothetical protein